MKNYIIFTTLLYFFSLNSFCQSQKTCDTPEEDIIDLNSISKCSIEELKDSANTRKVTLNVSSYTKNRSSHYIRKRKKEATSLNNTNGLQNVVGNILVENSITEKSLKISSQEVLFSVVDEIPLFPDCHNMKNEKKTKCFNDEISNHFATNFYPERASDNGINGKVFIQFVIDIKGKVVNLQVRGPKNANRLEEEVKRVINKLPSFTPGKHKGFPVNVKYSLPINFTLD
ncbi:TonB family protein [Tenacibaculum adriaticum]|uniref:TonB family protein n=1 Tax=Tenacibaculum adriaticum TaxID=413713 RepID=A0A5S5DM06_9FLAO|nr:energy transducer TonB [Tenacibaculum adriaticum]TYP96076.1 TonB family protein [Tenacibaculum adriaticum]